MRFSRLAVAISLSLVSSIAFASECTIAGVGTDMLPGKYALIGKVLVAERPAFAARWRCGSETCEFTDENGIEYAALLRAANQMEVFSIDVRAGVNGSVGLPFGLTMGDSLWTIVRKLVRRPGFPEIGIFAPTAEHVELSTGNCLRFPSGMVGALGISFDDAGRVTSVQLTIPWEGE